MKREAIDLSSVTDWDSFHDYFARRFDFPAHYGRNQDAWIDCMEECAIADGLLVLEITGMDELKARNREIYNAFMACSAAINRRSLASGGTGHIALGY